jgi:pilus assembly protein CpaE
MKKILVVDDDPVIRKMVSGLISKDGHQVETANDGLEGLTKFSKFKPDVIISDVLMPEMDGYEFCSKIRALPDGRQIPLLMLTSLDSVEQKIKGFEVGADDYIVKPFEPREFLARVAIMLKRSEVAQKISVVEKVGGKTIAVFSLRGGSGVSTIATNIAVGMAQIWGQPTTLVDMVMTGGQSALYLNLSLKNTWAEIAKFPVDEIDDFLVQSALLNHESGVFALASPRRPEMAELVTPEKISAVLPILKDISEYVILDLPHNFNSTTLAALDAADIKLIILQPEIVSIRSAVMALEIFEDLGYDMGQVHLILNWTFPRKGISTADIEKSLQRKISLVLPNASDELLQGLNFGAPPTYTTPEEPIGMLFEDLALALSKDEHRKQKPENPTEAWTRVVQRYRGRKTQ